MSRFGVSMDIGGTFTDVVAYHGLGPPGERDPEAVHADVPSRRLSARSAHEIYGFHLEDVGKERRK